MSSSGNANSSNTSINPKEAAVSTSTFLDNINPGKGQRNLKKILQRNPNIPAFQKTYSLHSMYAKAFQTQASHKKNDSTRAAKKQKIQDNNKGMMTEPFQPDSVLQFLSHLGVSTTHVHAKIGEVLRSKLEEEVEKIDLRSKEGFVALSKLLIQAWEARDVPELRPVLITVIKKMAEKTPTQLLLRLADRESDGSLKYADLFAQFGLPIKRLVWEADWEKGFTASLNEDDKTSSSLLTDMINEQITKYCKDPDLVLIADIPFVGSISDRKIPTQQRRNVGNVTSTNLPNSSNILGKKDDRGAPIKNTFEECTEAIQRIKEIIGGRPNLLAAIFHILIHRHGNNFKSNSGTGNKILGGKDYLSCTLVIDILMSFGALPKQYEFLGILAKILDDSVRSGIVSDDAIAQVQGCLRIIFAQAGPSSETKKKSESSTENTPGAETKLKPILPLKPKKYSIKEDKKYVLSLLQEVIQSAIAAMKETDEKLVFLNPVTDAIAPGYSRVISKPMCILTVAQKNNSKTYQSLQEFEKDVELMFQNCIKYNVGQDGIWFRGEAKRQRDIFKKNAGILSQAKGFWKKEIAERKKLMERKYEKTFIEEKKKAREDSSKAVKKDVNKALSVMNAKKADLAITRMTKSDILTLPPTKIKRKRKEPSTTIHIGSSNSSNSNKDENIDAPSIPALAAMMLSDPFVSRLFLEKVFRTIRVEVAKEKTNFLPSCHLAIPSLLQMLHIVQGSTQLCVIKGRKYTVPDAGMTKQVSSSSNTGTITINIKQEKDDNSVYYSILRVYTPRFVEFLVTLNIDDRLSIQGDLHPVLTSSSGPLSTMPLTTPSHWKNTSNFIVLRSLFQYALVHKFAGSSGGRNNEKLAMSLQSCLPRFLIVLRALSGGDMQKEKPFWRSLVGGLLNWKRKLGIKVRDLMVDFWLEWFKIKTNDGDVKKDKGCLCAPVHEMFIYLLNEVSI